jgi:chitinase
VGSGPALVDGLTPGLTAVTDGSATIPAAEDCDPAPTDPPNPDPRVPADPDGPPPANDGKGTTGSAPMPLPTRVVGVYYKAFSENPTPLSQSVPAGANVVYLSFLQGDPPHLTVDITPQLVADVKALRARGVRVIASAGGESGPTNIANPDTFVQGVIAVNAQDPLDGLDWDIEDVDSWDTANVVAISTRLKQLRGPAFAITMAPNGSLIDAYIPTAKALYDRDALDMIGQQFYGAPVTIDEAQDRVSQVAAAGIPDSRIGIGMMMPHGTDMAGKVWDLPTCIAALQTIRRDHPRLRGVYLWEANRTDTGEWAGQMSSMLRA